VQVEVVNKQNASSFRLLAATSKKRKGRLTTFHPQKYRWVRLMKNKPVKVARAQFSSVFLAHVHNGGDEIHSQRLVGNSTTKREGRGGAGKTEKNAQRGHGKFNVWL